MIPVRLRMTLVVENWNPVYENDIPYSLKFSRLKIFAVFAGYGDTTKILSREIFTHAKRFMGVARLRALDGHRSRTACILVPTGCRYRR